MVWLQGEIYTPALFWQYSTRKRSMSNAHLYFISPARMETVRRFSTGASGHIQASL
jgi:hypothetical protein